MPFGPMTLIFYWPKIFFSGPHFKHCYIGDNGKNSKQNLFSFYKTAKFLTSLTRVGELFKVIMVGTGVQLKLQKHPNAYIAI
jgi:hypothetical protein